MSLVPQVEIRWGLEWILGWIKFSVYSLAPGLQTKFMCEYKTKDEGIISNYPMDSLQMIPVDIFQVSLA